MRKNNSADGKKPHTKKYYIRLICLFTAVFTIFAFVITTWFAGDGSLLSYIENYEFTLYGDKNEQIEITEHENYSVIDNKSDKPLKILQLTDIHIGCGAFTSNLDKRAVEQVFLAVNAACPDLIIVTGDAISPIYVTSGTKNSYHSLDAFIALMEKTGIPWAFAFGNHDGEGLAGKDYVSERLEQAENCLYKRGDKDISGRGNYYIELREKGEFIYAIFIMDTGGGNFIQYEGVHEDQIEWYSNTVTNMKAEYGEFQSMLFMHMPLNEYQTAWDLYASGSDEVQKFYGEKGESVSAGVQRGFYDAIADLGSTKWVFCGHDHENNYSILMKDTGIRLTYSMSIDYSAYLTTKFKTSHRGATLILADKNTVEIKKLSQDNGYHPEN